MYPRHLKVASFKFCTDRLFSKTGSKSIHSPRGSSILAIATITWHAVLLASFTDESKASYD
jgi:hypothetical protein